MRKRIGKENTMNGELFFCLYYGGIYVLLGIIAYVLLSREFKKHVRDDDAAQDVVEEPAAPQDPTE